MSNYYNISYARVALLLLPTFLRRPLLLAFTKALMKPLDDLHRDFIFYQESVDTNTYSQVCYLQGLINDYFDPLERRFKITQAPIDRDSFLYWIEYTNKPVRIYKENTRGFIPRQESKEGQIGSNNPDFMVVLPTSYVLSESEETRLRAYVNQNKLASKRYIITHG